MAPFKDKFQWEWETRTGDTVVIDDQSLGEVTITPQSQVLTVRWPYGGWVWNRPLAILVERGTQTERTPIVDVTRFAQLALLALSLIFSCFILLRSIRGRRLRVRHQCDWVDSACMAGSRFGRNGQAMEVYYFSSTWLVIGRASKQHRSTEFNSAAL